MNRLLLASLAAALPAFGAAEAQLVVQLKPGADPAAVAKRDGVALRGVTAGAPFALYAVTSGNALDAQKRLAADAANVAWAEDNAEAQNPETSSAKGSSVQKGSSLSVVGDRNAVVAKDASALAQVGWNAGLAASAGRTVRLAILDDGLSRKQTALWAKVDASFDAFGGVADDASTGIDSNGDGVKDAAVGHGTMVAGIADAVAPNVRLVIAKVADSDGRATAWTIVQGLAFAATHGAEIANLSMGSVAAVAAFNDVAEWCAGQGLLVVAAIGNGGAEGAWYPSRSPKALCVAGVDAVGLKAGFSNWDGGADAAAPAVGIVSQYYDGGLAAWSGTSFAAPFVAAGLADCLRRTTPQTPASLVKAVNASGRNIDGLNAKAYKSKLGTLLDIAALNVKLKGKP